MVIDWTREVLGTYTCHGNLSFSKKPVNRRHTDSSPLTSPRNSFLDHISTTLSPQPFTTSSFMLRHTDILRSDINNSILSHLMIIKVPKIALECSIASVVPMQGPEMHLSRQAEISSMQDLSHRYVSESHHAEPLSILTKTAQPRNSSKNLESKECLDFMQTPEIDNIRNGSSQTRESCLSRSFNQRPDLRP